MASSFKRTYYGVLREIDTAPGGWVVSRVTGVKRSAVATVNSLQGAALHRVQARTRAEAEQAFEDLAIILEKRGRHEG